MHFCRALVCLVLAAAITYANGESSVWDNVGQVGWDNAEQLGAAVKEGVVSSLQWLGDRLGLARCRMPKDRVHALRHAIRDPIYGLIGQEHAVDQIVRRYQHHLYHPSGTLVLLFLGHAGAGKTLAANLIQNSLYLTRTENGRQGFVNFVGGDYVHKDFEQIFIRRLKLARSACGAKAETSNPVTVFLDELNELAHSPHARPIIAKIVDAMRDSKLSLDGNEVLDVRGWVFLFATDIHEQTTGGRAFREFTTRWVNGDLATEAVKRRYDRDFHQLMASLSDEHSHEYAALRFGSVTTADNIVVFMPYGFRLAREILVAMVAQSNQADGFRGQVSVTEALIDHIVDNELPYDTVEAGCGAAENGACLAERVVNGGGRAVRTTWEWVESAIIAALVPFRTCRRSVLEASTADNMVLCAEHHFVVGLLSEDGDDDPRLVVCQVTEPDEMKRAKEIKRLVHDISHCMGYALTKGSILHRRHV